MHVESLLTPHPLKLSENAVQQPLVAEVDPSTISELLNEAGNLGPEMYSDVLTDCVDLICRETRKALWYPTGDVKLNGHTIKRMPYPDLAHVENEQVADCYGFTLVASELMERADIPHFITYINLAYMNGHSTLLVPLGDGRLRLADPLRPDLNHDATSDLDTPGLLESLAAKPHEKHSVKFDALAMAHQLGMDWSEFIREFPWMSAKKDSGRYPGKEPKGQTLIASIFHPAEGRYVLETHARFLKAINEEDFLLAAHLLSSLRDLHPTIDLRQRHPEIRILSQNLARIGFTELARSSIEIYINGIAKVADDPRISILHGDCLRSVASTGQCETSALGAISAYERAVETTAVEALGLIVAKLAKARKLAAEVCNQAVSF